MTKIVGDNLWRQSGIVIFGQNMTGSGFCYLLVTQGNGCLLYGGYPSVRSVYILTVLRCIGSKSICRLSNYYNTRFVSVLIKSKYVSGSINLVLSVPPYHSQTPDQTIFDVITNQPDQLSIIQNTFFLNSLNSLVSSSDHVLK